MTDRLTGVSDAAGEAGGAALVKEASRGARTVVSGRLR